ncbi:SDR family oxidoreductase [Thalassospira profundimaris]|uniref:SDR family oxidoreductase n=1 Tax=Thalassospira profundimaris TaxID=502049 RepID=UPI000DED81CD|nr:SDR family oxidoreductase [Thalassospira profundimaris]
MKIVILGGYGVFGSRLAELLLRDGHDVVVAGRHMTKARSCADNLGCSALELDLHTCPERIFSVAPDVVVDAAGPFQAYRDDPYKIARLCLDHGADYLDFSDDAAFTAGVKVLDGVARRYNRCLLSGVSSVPGLSSVIARDLCQGLDDILLVDTAILPGNRAPRGTSVISGIVGQLGTVSRVWRGGVWRDQACWSDPRNLCLAGNLKRTARFIEVPDIRLFPDFFKARSVMFRAGMELGIFNAAMYWLGKLRRRWMFDVTPFRVGIIRKMADMLLPFGTDRGGMQVAVVGTKGGETVRRCWRLIAEAGDGPYIPTIAARVVIRKLALGQVGAGARPCLAETSRVEAEQAMTDLSVSFQVDENPARPLFQSVLRDRWSLLPPEIRALHSVYDMESFSGQAEVTRGRSLMARAIAWFFGFPPASPKCAVSVTKTRTETGEIWQRNFGGKIFQSRCRAAAVPYRFREGFGLFNYEMDVDASDAGIELPVRRGWFMGVPLPRFLLPKSDSREYVQNRTFHFDVKLTAPLGIGLIVRYRGSLHPDGKVHLPGHARAKG